MVTALFVMLLGFVVTYFFTEAVNYSFIGAGVALVYAMIPKQIGALSATGFDLTALNAQIGAFYRRYDKEIWKAITRGITFEKYMRGVPNVTDEYVSPHSSHTEFLQPYQSGFQEKGSVSFDARKNKVFHIKMDFLLQDIYDIYRSYLSFLSDESKDIKDWPFVKYIVYEHIIPGIIEEISILSVKGAYVAPTPGTAGTSISSADGVLTIVANEISGMNLNPIVTGAITQANVIDAFNDYYDGMHDDYKGMPGEVFMAPSVKLMYERAQLETYGATQTYKGPQNETFIFGTRKKLVEIPEFEGSQRLLHTPKKNLLKLYNKINVPNSVEIQKENRDLKFLLDFHRGYGFGNLYEVFTNDQA